MLLFKIVADINLGHFLESFGTLLILTFRVLIIHCATQIEINCATYTDSDALYDNFCTLFFGIVESFIPRKNVTVHPHDKPWMTNLICCAIRKHGHLLEAYSRSKSTVFKGIQ